VLTYSANSLAECPADEPVIRAETLALYALAAGTLNEDSRPALLEAIEVFRQAGDLRQAGNARSNLGNIEWSLGDWTAAETCWRISLTEQEQAGYAVGVGWTAVNMAEIAMDRGLDTVALDLISRAEEIAGATRDRALADNAGINRAAVLMRQGRFDDASALLASLDPREPDLAIARAQRQVELALLRTQPDVAAAKLDALSDHSAAKARLAAIAQAQTGAVDIGHAALSRIGRDATVTAFERGLALEALSRIETDAAVLEEAYTLLRGLGIVRITTIPVRADEQPARVTI
jgi:tetratricopeptide (TPR) repeat protein